MYFAYSIIVEIFKIIGLSQDNWVLLLSQSERLHVNKRETQLDGVVSSRPTFIKT